MQNVHIGEGTILGVHVSAENCRIGAHCVLHSGVRIGADGFGFALEADGTVTALFVLDRCYIGKNSLTFADPDSDMFDWLVFNA